MKLIIIYDNYLGGTLVVKEYVKENGDCPFRSWLERLDRSTRAKIQARLLRFELGNLGDYKSLGQSIYEARLDFGPGYRVYFGLRGKTIVLLLLGGDKKTQIRDIYQARKYWKDYLENQNE